MPASTGQAYPGGTAASVVNVEAWKPPDESKGFHRERVPAGEAGGEGRGAFAHPSYRHGVAVPLGVPVGTPAEPVASRPPMEIDVVETPAVAVEADVLAFAVLDPAELPPAARELDRLLGGRLERLVADGELKGSRGTVTLLHTDGEIAARRVAAVGAGKRADADGDALRTAAARAAERTAAVGGRALAWLLDESLPLGAAEQARAVVDGAVIASYEAGRWKTDEGERPKPAERLVLCGPEAAGAADEARGEG